jgi:hypothetical protein
MGMDNIFYFGQTLGIDSMNGTLVSSNNKTDCHNIIEIL